MHWGVNMNEHLKLISAIPNMDMEWHLLMCRIGEYMKEIRDTENWDALKSLQWIFGVGGEE